jgi:predicted nucleic acid-binding protein
VILLHVNIPIYAVNHDAPLHRKAKTWLEAALEGKETAGISWRVLPAFLRVTTRAGLFRNPLPVPVAFDLIDSWLVQPSSDAHLAALAMEHKAELCSSDGDFARFPRLRWRNPLV